MGCSLVRRLCLAAALTFSVWSVAGCSDSEEDPDGSAGTGGTAGTGASAGTGGTAGTGAEKEGETPSAPPPSAAPKAARGQTDFMSKMEERWRKRREGNNGQL